jgi:hypothetical protein
MTMHERTCQLSLYYIVIAHIDLDQGVLNV